MSDTPPPFALEPQRYWRPPSAKTPSGAPRRMGIEVEFAGLSLEHAATRVAEALGGEAELDDHRRVAQVSSPWGPVKVELDATHLRDKRYLETLEQLGLEPGSAATNAIDETVQQVAAQVVPLEVVTPPIPWPELPQFDAVWSALHDAGALGTHSSVLRAFGLHLNPEIDSEAVDRVVATLQSYLLLEDWLMQTLGVDPSRQISPFIRAFPERYRRRLLTRGYHPDWAQFIADYAEDNPTRNRRVDLWPLIRHLTGDAHAERVRDWHLVKPRPTYHYRLPDCEIGLPGWTPAKACNGWVLVERLARADETRFELAQCYLDAGDLPLRLQTLSWVDEVRKRLPRLAEAGDREAA